MFMKFVSFYVNYSIHNKFLQYVSFSILLCLAGSVFSKLTFFANFSIREAFLCKMYIWKTYKKLKNSSPFVFEDKNCPKKNQKSQIIYLVSSFLGFILKSQN